MDEEEFNEDSVSWDTGNEADAIDSPPLEDNQEDDLAPIEADDADSQDDPAAKQTPPDDDPEEEWEAGGQVYKIKKSELRAGYMKDADYRQKTAKAAEHFRAVEQFAQQMQQERQNTANQLDTYLQTLHAELIGSQPNPALIEQDPQEFLRQQATYNQRAQHFQRAQAERQALAQNQTMQEQQQQALRLQQEQERLVQVLPEWRNPKTRQAESKELADYLASVGFAPHEIGSVSDHRAILIARDAAKFRALQAAKQKQTQAPPPKPVRPGASGSAGGNSTVQRAQERLRRNGNDLDALAGLLGASGI